MLLMLVLADSFANVFNNLANLSGLHKISSVLSIRKNREP